MSRTSKSPAGPLPSRLETKSEATTKAAWQIIDAEASAKATKTERLRAARLAREDGGSPEIPKSGLRSR